MAVVMAAAMAAMAVAAAATATAGAKRAAHGAAREAWEAREAMRVCESQVFARGSAWSDEVRFANVGAMKKAASRSSAGSR
jgi:hypothetical protein